MLYYLAILRDRCLKCKKVKKEDEELEILISHMIELQNELLSKVVGVNPQKKS